MIDRVITIERIVLMSNRFSVEKSAWSIEREDYYKKECYNITYVYKHQLIIENKIAYVLSDKEKITISKPEKDTSFWLETWIHLKDFYNC